jgi:hypothetical protein
MALITGLMQKEIAIPNPYFSVCEPASTTTSQFLVLITGLMVIESIN